MQTDESIQSSGAAYAADALPFNDLAEAGRAAPFEVRHSAVLLRGSVSRSSGSLAFPSRAVCLETGARDMEPMLFGPRGTLYSYTTVHVSSIRPTPYAIGYVDFPNGVRVLADVESSAALDGSLACDTPVELHADDKRWFVVPVAPDTGAGQ